MCHPKISNYHYHHYLSAFIGLCLLVHFTSLMAATNDVFPGDYYPPEPGFQSLSFYLIDRDLAGPYAQGNKVADASISANFAAVRGVHAFDLAGMTATTVAVLSWAGLESDQAALANAIGRQSTGLGDLRLGLTVWPIKDRENANYLGLSAMVMAPTGEYDSSQVLNYGENRWKLILTAGWQKDISPKLLFELIPELTLYGENDDYVRGNKLEQDPALALTGYLRWRTLPGFHLHIGGQLNAGGETRLNGVKQNNPPDNTRVNIGATWFLPDKQQLIFRLAKETDSENGFRNDGEVALRYQVGF
jgi:hypothetical protein